MSKPTILYTADGKPQAVPADSKAQWLASGHLFDHPPRTESPSEDEEPYAYDGGPKPDDSGLTKAQMQAMLDEAGVEYDKRWGREKLSALITADSF